VQPEYKSAEYLSGGKCNSNSMLKTNAHFASVPPVCKKIYAGLLSLPCSPKVLQLQQTDQRLGYHNTDLSTGTVIEPQAKTCAYPASHPRSEGASRWYSSHCLAPLNDSLLCETASLISRGSFRSLRRYRDRQQQDTKQGTALTQDTTANFKCRCSLLSMAGFKSVTKVTPASTYIRFLGRALLLSKLCYRPSLRCVVWWQKVCKRFGWRCET